MVVAFLGGEWVFLKKIINGLEDEPGTHGFAEPLAGWRVTTEVKVVGRLARVRRDACRHTPIATRASHHLSHEVGLDVAGFLDDVGECKTLGDAILLTELVEVFGGNHRDEVVFLKEIDDLLSVDHGSGIDGVS